MNLWQRIRNTFTPATLTSPNTRVTDQGAWTGVLLDAGTGPADRPWSQLATDLDDALEAWRKNFLIRQIVRLTTAYVVGDGITLKAGHPYVTTFLPEFWNHRQNHISRRLSAWCDELTRSGELFIALFTNAADGMSYVRAVPARSIERVETDPEDYEKELYYYERVQNQIELKKWPSPLTATLTPYSLLPTPVLLHFAVNQPVGATRGESDLTPILPWARRYTEWLKDRIRFNRVRTEMAAAWIKIADDSQLERKRRQYEQNPPTGGNIFVTGPAEELSFPSANIAAGDASPDGLALRLAIAAGADIPLHYLGEGQTATRTTAEAMGDPTRRHYRMRQLDFAAMLCSLAEQAYLRRCEVLGVHRTFDVQIEADMPDVSREDNTTLATAANTIVQAFSTMAGHGWIDDETAVRLAFKFAGEVLTDEQIKDILAKPVNILLLPQAPPQPPPPAKSPVPSAAPANRKDTP
jgi:hypothetical protein